jgi:hypothetical protein
LGQYRRADSSVKIDPNALFSVKNGPVFRAITAVDALFSVKMGADCALISPLRTVPPFDQIAHGLGIMARGAQRL